MSIFMLKNILIIFIIKVINETYNGGFEMEVYLKIKEVLTKREITQKTLSEMTGLRPTTISEMVNNQRQTINKEHLAKVIEVLAINDIREIIDFKIESK